MNKLLTVRRAINNLESIAKDASTLNWEEGISWYEAAHLFARKIAEFKSKLDDNLSLARRIELVCGIIAALSPQCPWEENISAASQLIITGTIEKTLCYPANINKAKRILSGENPLDVLGGLKVRAFYDNILNYKTSNVVTVDTHASRAAFNKLTLTTQEVRWVFRKNGNAVIQEAYKTVAKKYNVTPCVLQAVIWLRVKDVINTPMED